MTSIAIVIPYIVDGVKKYFVHTHSFIPKSRVDEHIKTDKIPYDLWIEKGLVTVTETLGGIKTDYKYIIKYLEDLIKEYGLKPQLICYDPHNASAFLSDLEALPAHVTGGMCYRNQILKSIRIKLKNRIRFQPVLRRV